MVMVANLVMILIIEMSKAFVACVG